MGLAATRTIHRIVIDPNNSDVVYVAAMGSIWGPNEERGVYKTTDGGKTWNRILFTNNLSGCAELIMDPNNPNKMFAAMWEYRRKPYHFNSGGPGSGLFMTIDGGKTWKRLGQKEGLPEGPLGRLGLGIATNKAWASPPISPTGYMPLWKAKPLTSLPATTADIPGKK
ncbi:MAG: hypothetical protein RIT07_934 [Bacteroidota bacterium]